MFTSHNVFPVDSRRHVRPPALSAHMGSFFTECKVSPDNQHMLLIARGQLIYGKLQAGIQPITLARNISACDFSSDNRYVFILVQCSYIIFYKVAELNTVPTPQSYRLQNRPQVRRYRPSTLLVVSPCVYTPNQYLIATLNSANKKEILLFLHEMPVGNEISFLKLTGHADEVTALAFSAQGERLISGSKNGQVIIWDMVDGCFSMRANFKAHKEEITCLAFSPNNDTFISAAKLSYHSTARNLKLWTLRDIEDLQRPGSINSFKNSQPVQRCTHEWSLSPVGPLPNTCRYSPGGRYLIVAISHNLTRIDLLALADHPQVQATSFTSGHTIDQFWDCYVTKAGQVLACTEEGRVGVWDNIFNLDHPPSDRPQVNRIFPRMLNGVLAYPVNPLYDPATPGAVPEVDVTTCQNEPVSIPTCYDRKATEF